MKRFVFILFVFLWGCSFLPSLQRSNLIAVFHLIENGSYEEAKEVIDDMVLDRESMKWPRTWYARGVLAHEAYVEGVKKKDKKKFELYPDQLYVAYESFERALRLDKSGRLDRQVAPRYVYLANEFQKKGEQSFKNGHYEEALKSFQSALTISQSEILEVNIDTNLIYNASLASYESDLLDQSADYLILLNSYDFSPNVSHLLFDVYLEKGDTLEAEEVLIEGIEKYKESEDLVLLLADNLYNRSEWERAINILDSASVKQPQRSIFPFTQGLIYQKNEQYREAIDAFEKAHELAPDDLLIYVNIATCYYNIGVEIDEYARTINLNRRVLEERAKADKAFENSLKWLDRVYEKKPDDQDLLRRIHQIYKILNVEDKVSALEQRLK